MAKHVAPNVPFVEARNVGGSQKPTAIVLSLSSTTSDKGAALGIANYHHSVSAPLVSYHYIVDNRETYRCIPHNVAAYHSPHRSLSVLICAQPHEYEPLWENATASRVMHRAADLVAELIFIHKIPVRYLDKEMEEKWDTHKWRHRGGLIVRVIGTWPYEAFLKDVKENIQKK